MRRAPAVLAIALCARGAVAAPCASRAALAGDPAAVARVREELAKLGPPLATAACRVVRAQVSRREDGGFAVAIVDGAGRSEAREVSDAAVAAAWIDSWLHDELEAWAMAPIAAATTLGSAPGATAPTAAPGAVAMRSPAREREAHVDASVPQPPRSLWSRGALAVDYERVFDADPTWTGGSAAACAVIGPLCVGLRARYAHQGVDATNNARTEVAALATASTALALGRMALAPELGLGVGRLTTQRDAVCKNASDSCTFPDDPACRPTCFDPNGDEVTAGAVRTVDSYRPRVQLAVRVGVPLFEHVWLDAIGALTLIPFAHTADYVPETASTGDATVLPGDPTHQWQLGVGLRVGAP